jgi:hypothetical protein
MAITARFRHTLTISRFAASGTANARGNLVRGYVDDTATIKGNLQERAAKEVPSGELAGVALSDAIAFLPITAATGTLGAPDRLTKGGLVYELIGLPRDAGGRGRHLEADLRRVTT